MTASVLPALCDVGQVHPVRVFHHHQKFKNRSFSFTHSRNYFLKNISLSEKLTRPNVACNRFWKMKSVWHRTGKLKVSGAVTKSIKRSLVMSLCSCKEKAKTIILWLETWGYSKIKSINVWDGVGEGICYLRSFEILYLSIAFIIYTTDPSHFISTHPGRLLAERGLISSSQPQCLLKPCASHFDQLCLPFMPCQTISLPSLLSILLQLFSQFSCFPGYPQFS